MRHPVLLRRRRQRHRHDPRMVDRSRAPRARVILQAGQPIRGVPVTPVDHRRPRHPNPLGDRHVRLAISREQHDPRPLRQASLHRRGPHQPRQLLPVPVAQRQSRCRTIRHTPSSQPNNSTFQRPGVRALGTRPYTDEASSSPLMLTRGFAAVTSSLRTSASSSAEPKAGASSCDRRGRVHADRRTFAGHPIPRLIDGICGREGEGNAATLPGLDGP